MRSNLALKILIGLIMTISLTFIIFIFVKAFTAPKADKYGVVVNKYATRTIFVYEEHIATFWDWTVPEEGEILEEKQDVYSYDTYGNPIYRTKYKYGVTRWFFEHSIHDKITENKTWIEFPDDGKLYKIDKETYTISVKKASGKVITENITQELWEDLCIGDEVTIENGVISPIIIRIRSATE